MNTEKTKGLFISTQSMKAYPLKKGSKPIQFNQYSLIFGNG
jgi:hypothetical protein